MDKEAFLRKRGKEEKRKRGKEEKRKRKRERYYYYLSDCTLNNSSCLQAQTPMDKAAVHRGKGKRKRRERERERAELEKHQTLKGRCNGQNNI